MTPEEADLINAALEWRNAELGNRITLIERLRTAANALTFACWECNKGGHTCPGCGEHVGHAGVGVCPRCSAEINGEQPRDERTVPLSPEEPAWVPRTWRDVVTGDSVRMPGTEITAHITLRLRHPSEDPLGQSWHMVAGEKHWDDVLVQPGQVCVSLDGGQPRFMKPEAPVEIEMTPAELTAIAWLGNDWSMRQKLLTTE